MSIIWVSIIPTLIYVVALIVFSTAIFNKWKYLKQTVVF